LFSQFILTNNLHPILGSAKQDDKNSGLEMGKRNESGVVMKKSLYLMKMQKIKIRIKNRNN
jgi:hypothetical protein